MYSSSILPRSATYQSCGCIGPQNGEPLCPCAMRGVKIVDGRYVQDLGPVKPKSQTNIDWHKTIAEWQGISAQSQDMGKAR